MKTQYKIQLAVILLSLSLASCSDDFLNKDPRDEIASENFWQTEEDIKLALAGCYNHLSSQTYGFGAYTMHWDAISDNAYPRDAPFLAVTLGQIESTTGGIVSDVYDINYDAIATCNYFLANASAVEMDPTVLEQYMAEVRFLRAYYYFQLTNVYGGVIATLEPEGIEDAHRPKSSKEEILALILEDIDYAIAHLPDDAYTGRVVKGSALALKTRIHLYNEAWEEAAAAAEQVIDGGKFQLSEDYYGLFVKPGQEGNPSILFSARYQLPDMYHGLDYRYGWDQWELVQPIADLVDSYESIDGEPIGTSGLYDPERPYANRDPRLKKTVILPGDPWAYSADGIFDPSSDGRNLTGFLPKKYLDTTRAPTSYSTRSDQDWVILRYADVLLMYAEAQNEIAGPGQRVYDMVNAVRTRSGIDMPPLPDGLSKDQMRQRIRHERRVEFALEGTRYFDLKRWGIADEVIPQIVNPGGDHRVFDQKHYVWPFPQSEIDINPELEQNSGY